MSEKIYDVSADWSKRALIDDAKYREMYARSVKDPNSFWAEQAKRVDWIKAPTKVENVSFAPGNISIKWFEDGVLNAAYNCIDRHLAKRGDQTAIIWEGDDPSQSQAHHLPAAARRSLPDGQHPAHAQRQEGRPRHHLSADDSRSRLRDARLRAHRRHPLGGVRRLLARQPRAAHHRLPVQDRHHRRRRPARRPQGAAEGQCRCGARKSWRRRLGRRGQAHRRRRRHEPDARSLVSRRRRDGDDGMPVRADECGGSAVHPLHVGLDRPAQGRAAHHRRLSRLRRDDASIRLRLSRRRHLLVHRRRRLGHRPQLHSLWAARQRRDHADVRGRAELSGQFAVLERGRQAQGQHLLHRADRDPRADAGRRRAGEEDLAQIAAPARFGRRADQSGSVGMVSPRRRRRAAARSSTPGGRPRPAAS